MIQGHQSLPLLRILYDLEQSCLEPRPLSQHLARQLVLALLPLRTQLSRLFVLQDTNYLGCATRAYGAVSEDLPYRTLHCSR